MPDNIIQVGIQTTGAEQAQSAANQAAQGIQNVGNAASESASQTQNFGAATGEATSLLDRLILMAKEAGQALSEMGTNAAEAGAEVKESMVGAGEAVTTLGEKAKLAGGSFSAMGAAGGLGALLGIGAAAGLVAEALNSVMEKAEKMEHMAWVSGDSVEQIAELVAEAAKYGITLDNLGMTLTKIDQMVTKYREGDAETVKIVKELGIHHTDLIGVLTDLDKAWSQAIDKEKFVSDVKKLLGRNIYDQLVLFSAEKGHLETNMKGHEDYAASVKKLAEEKQNLNVIEAKMSEAWTSLASDVLPILSAGLQIFIARWADLKEIILTVTDVISASLGTILVGLGGLAKVAYDLMHGNFLAAKEEAKESASIIGASWKAAGKDIWNSADAANRAWLAVAATAKSVKPPELPAGDLGPPGADPKAVNAAAKRAAEEEELSGEEAHQKALLELKRHAIEDSYKLEQIGWDQEAAALDKVEAAELAMTLSFINKKISIAEQDPDHPEKVTKLNEQKIAAKDAYNAKIQEIESKRLEAQKKYDDEFQKLQDEIADRTRLDNEKKLDEAQKAFDKLMAMMVEWHKKQIEAEDETQIKLNESKMRGSQSSEKKDLESFAGNPEAQAKIIANYRDQQIEIEKVITDLKVKLALEKGASPEDVSAIKSEGAEKISEITDQANIKISHLKLTMKDLETTFESAFKKMGTAFNTAMAGWITGTESFRKAFSKGLLQMEGDLVQSLLRMAEQWLKHLALKAAAKQVADTTDVVSTQVAASEKNSIEQESNLKSIFMSAKSAAAKAWDALSNIPLVGPILGAAAAAATFAGVMALAAFEQGGIVGGLGSEQLAMVHKNEMILPASISQKVQDSVTNPNQAQGSGGGDVHLHVHAIDVNSVKNFFHNNRDQVARTMKRAMRDGHPAFA